LWRRSCATTQLSDEDRAPDDADGPQLAQYRFIVEQVTSGPSRGCGNPEREHVRDGVQAALQQNVRLEPESPYWDSSHESITLGAALGAPSATARTVSISLQRGERSSKSLLARSDAIT